MPPIIIRLTCETCGISEARSMFGWKTGSTPCPHLRQAQLQAMAGKAPAADVPSASDSSLDKP